MLEQLTSLAELSHYVEVVLVLVDLVEAYNVQVVRTLEDLQFLLKQVDINLDLGSADIDFTASLL